MTEHDHTECCAPPVDPFPDVNNPWNEINRLRSHIHDANYEIQRLRAELLALKGRTAPDWAGQSPYSPTTETKDMQ